MILPALSGDAAASTTMTAPRVTVYVPCRNYGHFLREALDRVAAQSLPDWELIVFDEGSTDDTLAIACDDRFRAQAGPIGKPTDAILLGEGGLELNGATATGLPRRCGWSCCSTEAKYEFMSRKSQRSMSQPLDTPRALS